MAASPTARTLEYCRKRSWPCGVVERWVPQARKRIDLFGCIDLICLDGELGSLGIQATSTGNMSSRVTKAKGLDALRLWLEAGNRFSVWGWAKRGPAGKRKLWTLRQQPITLEELEVS